MKNEVEMDGDFEQKDRMKVREKNRRGESLLE